MRENISVQPSGEAGKEEVIRRAAALMAADRK